MAYGGVCRSVAPVCCGVGGGGWGEDTAHHPGLTSPRSSAQKGRGSGSGGSIILDGRLQQTQAHAAAAVAT
jgi:hypothetical protein